MVGVVVVGDSVVPEKSGSFIHSSLVGPAMHRVFTGIPSVLGRKSSHVLGGVSIPKETGSKSVQANWANDDFRHILMMTQYIANFSVDAMVPRCKFTKQCFWRR